ncbi:DUF4138 domain-containing protein [Aquimarina mytili]|uniref:DUF4138 domain-containing protein n=1 Tax=Aquimarina mytili TaxID=874423 RepID=A0A937A397_9FLAO|nr:DUF4138 domain-containing protein [Aquimarina mytili]MBL0686071.1 DUF4138 domain-containing protein [Aquimarina mytili]
MRILINLLLLTQLIYSQKDTLRIEVAESKYTQLIFTSEVVDKDPGHMSYQIVKSTSANPNDKILKLYYAGTAEDYTFPSNLQVETSNGDIYDLKLINTENPKKTTYIITPNMAVVNINQMGASSTPMRRQEITNTEEETLTKVEAPITHYSDKSDVPDDAENYSEIQDRLYVSDKLQYMTNLAKELNDTKRRYSRVKSVAVKQNIELTIKGVYADKDELYFVFNMKNDGAQPFDIKVWKIYRGSVELAKQLETGNLSGKGLIQPLNYKPETVYNLSKRIEPKSQMNFVIVISKFTIAKDRAVYFDIDELNGERDIFIPLYYKRVNYPLNYKRKK